MRLRKNTQFIVALFSCMGLVLQSIPAIAAAPSGFAQDVAANASGGLSGTVTDTKGQAIAGARIHVRQAGAVIAETTADDRGAFDFGGLRGGVYQIATTGTAANVRLWAGKTAPPSAANGVLLVTSSQVVRGQCCTDTCNDGGCGASCTTPSSGCGCGGGCGLMSGCGVPGGCGVAGCGGGGGGGGSLLPWVVVAGAAAAIAIPLALDDDDAS